MANTFKSYTGNFGSTGDFTHTVPGATTTVALGLNIANKEATQADISVDVTVTDASNGNTVTHIVDNMIIPNGGAVQVISGKIILETGDIVTVSASGAAANSGSAILSVMEIS